MPRNAEVYRETIVNERTSETTGTATVPTTDGDALTSIEGMGLENFDELLIYIKTSTSLAGTNPTMNLFFQRAIVPSPDPAVDAHWADITAVPQITTSADLIGVLPIGQSVSISASTDNWRTRGLEGETADVATAGHWGDRLRVREKMGGTVTTAAVYSIHVTGRIN